VRRRSGSSARRRRALTTGGSVVGAAVLLATLGGGAPLPVAASASWSTVFSFDDEVTESSGLVDLGSRVLTVNDSGDDAVVYVIDPATGETVGRTTYAEEVRDVEALALGPDGDVWIGDIGDNPGSRTGVQVHRIEVPEDGDREVDATTYDFVYRGGARDAEALLVSPEGRLHVVSKGLFGGQVYVAPEVLREGRPHVLTPIGSAQGMITDGAWHPDGRHVVLRNYHDAFVYDTDETPWRYVGRARLPSQRQGEGLAVRRDGSLLISSEGRRQPVLEVTLPPRLVEAMESQEEAEPAAPEVVDEVTEGRWRGLVAAVLGGVVLLVVARRLLRLSPRR
jgi:hypothetical protein